MFFYVFQVVNDLKNAPVGTAFFHPYHKPTVAEQLSCIQLSVKLADLPTGRLLMHACGQSDSTVLEVARGGCHLMHSGAPLHVAAAYRLSSV